MIESYESIARELYREYRNANGGAPWRSLLGDQKLAWIMVAQRAVEIMETI